MSKKVSASQISLFDSYFANDGVIHKADEIQRDFLFDDKDKVRFDNYKLEDYCQDVINNGLKHIWNKINYYILNFERKNVFLNIENLCWLYEIGLALINKHQKKDNGQYYTPEDVALVMSSWLNELDAVNVCDVACGTGKLILTYLDVLGIEKAKELINEGHLYLYDLDDIALSICKTIILKKYGKNLESKINIIHCDFLDKEVSLPDNCKVISNPPYSTVSQLLPQWNKTNVTLETKELYSMFMEKIISQSVASVIITPYSFIGGNKFYPLRLLMNNYSGFIVSFDNVPGNIFCGRKHGIFNTNTSNSVRAAITVVKNPSCEKGFRLTPLLRFKNTERKDLLNCEKLESFISERVQIIDDKNPTYFKCHKELQNIFDSWLNISDDKTLKDCLSQSKTDYVLHIPNTCRYFTTASTRKLNRAGVIELYIKDSEQLVFLYCLINSSFAYWWWRIFDGGITYPISLLNKLPIFFDKLSDDDKIFFNNIFNEMTSVEQNYIVTKLNAGTKQENIKFPTHYRSQINRRLLKILSCKEDSKLLDIIHKNNIFGQVDTK